MQLAFNAKQMIKFQQVNIILYKRIAQWIKNVLIFPKIRFSERAEIDFNNDNSVVRFPTEELLRSMIKFENNSDCSGAATLAGFECSKGGQGTCFKFVFSNGMKSEGNIDGRGVTTHLMPLG